MKISKLSTRFMLDHKKDIIKGFDLATHPQFLKKIPDKSIMLQDNGKSYFITYKKVKSLKNLDIVSVKRN